MCLYMLLPEYGVTLAGGAIVYIAAIAALNVELYEAATVDGAGRLRRIWHITIPGIMPTVITMFILKMGGILV